MPTSFTSLPLPPSHTPIIFPITPSHDARSTSTLRNELVRLHSLDYEILDRLYRIMRPIVARTADGARAIIDENKLLIDLRQSANKIKAELNRRGPTGGGGGGGSGDTRSAKVKSRRRKNKTHVVRNKNKTRTKVHTKKHKRR